MYKYEVNGMGQFPDDMLRYDRAKIIGQRRDTTYNGPAVKLIYTILSDRMPTVGRWNSFLWHVRNLKKVGK